MTEQWVQRLLNFGIVFAVVLALLNGARSDFVLLALVSICGKLFLGWLDSMERMRESMTGERRDGER